LGADPQVVKKRLASFNRDATTALDRALHALIWTRGEAFHPPVVLPRRLGRPIIAYPSRFAAEAFYGFGACAGFVTFVDLDARFSADGSVLAKAFGLTPAEARLAVRFLAEESLEAAAVGLGISIDTARNQLKSIYQKTGVRRQGEIIALLSRLARF
ncbi:MAG TPA: helix-turn-helix transcriptional regulator, partial [Roseiarcus sp.]|nr:helix-turn-helix transcriptional regulator [Roseiarcus sp.]